MQSIETDDKATPADEISEAVARVQDWADDTERDDYLDEDIRKLLTTLAAERDRADRAEARLEEAWDEGAAFGWHSSGVKFGDNPYRLAATA